MIVIAAYRDWGISVFKKLPFNKKIVKTNKELKIFLKKNKKPIYCIIFIGWSEYVSKLILRKFLCLCFHPSDLPKYRGGSPIQNQIINNVTKTRGTLFKMNDKIDSGPIYAKHKLDLRGDMSDIFKSLESTCFFLVNKFLIHFLNGKKIKFYNQNNNKATYFDRRTPKMSEITLNDLSKLTSSQLYNKIRALGDPYPNAFLRTKDGKRLLIKKVVIK
jgi:methionyl-tRNA formyltransferase